MNQWKNNEKVKELGEMDIGPVDFFKHTSVRQE